MPFIMPSFVLCVCRDGDRRAAVARPHRPGPAVFDKQTMGNIIQRHVEVFRSNPYFRGLSIPEPEERVDLTQKLPHSDPIVIDFLLKCFDPNPALRFTCAELLQHEYFNGYQPQWPPEEPTTPLKKMSSSSHLPFLGTGGKDPKGKSHVNYRPAEQNRSYLPTLI
ncbi:Kinase domain protein [Aphelenchoides fujianensis]|nr:Kinase domain protein [Aphelenchoides fujianensis]